jgi:hypothetical protein
MSRLDAVCAKKNHLPLTTLTPAGEEPKTKCHSELEHQNHHA